MQALKWLATFSDKEDAIFQVTYPRKPAYQKEFQFIE
jgi:hypothetical protein